MSLICMTSRPYVKEIVSFVCCFISLERAKNKKNIKLASKDEKEKGIWNDQRIQYRKNDVVTLNLSLSLYKKLSSTRNIS